MCWTRSVPPWAWYKDRKGNTSINFLTNTYVVSMEINCLNEAVLLSTQKYMLKLIGKKLFIIFTLKNKLRPMTRSNLVLQDFKRYTGWSPGVYVYHCQNDLTFFVPNAFP